MPESGRVPRTFARLLGSSFLSGGVLATALIGLAISIIQLIWRPEAKVSGVWLVVTVTVALVVVATLLHAASTAHASALRRLPSIRIVKPAPPSYRGVRCVLLLEHSELFVTDATVSLYALEEEEYEAIVGIGRVASIQDNGLIQVALMHIVPEQEQLLHRLVANDKTALKSVIVKPHVATSMREYFGDQS